MVTIENWRSNVRWTTDSITDHMDRLPKLTEAELRILNQLLWAAELVLKKGAYNARGWAGGALHELNELVGE